MHDFWAVHGITSSNKAAFNEKAKQAAAEQRVQRVNASWLCIAVGLSEMSSNNWQLHCGLVSSKVTGSIVEQDRATTHSTSGECSVACVMKVAVAASG